MVWTYSSITTPDSKPRQLTGSKFCTTAPAAPNSRTPSPMTMGTPKKVCPARILAGQTPEVVELRGHVSNSCRLAITFCWWLWQREARSFPLIHEQNQKAPCKGGQIIGFAIEYHCPAWSPRGEAQPPISFERDEDRTLGTLSGRCTPETSGQVSPGASGGQ